MINFPRTSWDRLECQFFAYLDGSLHNPHALGTVWGAATLTNTLIIEVFDPHNARVSHSPTFVSNLFRKYLNWSPIISGYPKHKFSRKGFIKQKMIRKTKRSAGYRKRGWFCSIHTPKINIWGNERVKNQNVWYLALFFFHSIIVWLRIP